MREGGWLQGAQILAAPLSSLCLLYALSTFLRVVQRTALHQMEAEGKAVLGVTGQQQQQQPHCILWTANVGPCLSPRHG